MLWAVPAEDVAPAVPVAAVSVCFTVMVLAELSTETISALTTASFFLEDLSSALAALFSSPVTSPGSD